MLSRSHVLQEEGPRLHRGARRSQSISAGFEKSAPHAKPAMRQKTCAKLNRSKLIFPAGVACGGQCFCPRFLTHAQNGPVEPPSNRICECYDIAHSVGWRRSKSNPTIKNDAARPHTIMMNVGMPRISAEANNIQQRANSERSINDDGHVRDARQKESQTGSLRLPASGNDKNGSFQPRETHPVSPSARLPLAVPRTRPHAAAR